MSVVSSLKLLLESGQDLRSRTISQTHAKKIRRRIIDKHGKNSDEGAHIRSLREIRVCAEPSWSSDVVTIDLLFIKNSDPADTETKWDLYADLWLSQFDQSGRFRFQQLVVYSLDDVTAREYVDSERLDFDRLSVE